MSVLTIAKTKAARGDAKEAFKNEVGAIDLASIMVGIIVIGLIGAVIAATVFAVIPWTQDNVAKQQLESVSNAQNAYLGVRANNTNGSATEAVRFGTKKDLVTEVVLPNSAPVLIAVNVVDKDGAGAFDPLLDTDGAGPLDPVKENAGTGAAAHFITISKSVTGKFFWSVDGSKAKEASSLANAKEAAEAVVTAPTAPATFKWSYDGSV
jgi:type II secretory pathway pseudopilin PulG